MVFAKWKKGREEAGTEGKGRVREVRGGVGVAGESGRTKREKEILQKRGK